jgi:hypothetical protein
MEHIIKQTESEIIKRFELSNKNIWLIKYGNEFGMGFSKKEAESRLGKQYAHRGIPDFLNELGSVFKYNNRPQVNSFPGALSFIQSLLPLSWHSRYFFRTIADQNSPRTFLEIAWVLVPETEPLRYWSDDPEGHHKQILNCVYEFYIDREQITDLKKQNPKLAEWQKNWYSKLVPKRIP